MFVTQDERSEHLVSSNPCATERKLCGLDATKTMVLSKKCRKYVSYHREFVFKGPYQIAVGEGPYGPRMSSII